MTNGADPPLRVTMFMRHPIPGWHSIENVFDVVRQHLSDDIEVELVVLPFQSRRLIPRLRNLWFAWRHRGDINHITGDVHFLAMVLPKSRTILTVHDLAGVSTLRGVRRWLHELLWYRIPVRRCAAITTVSRITADSLVDLIPGCADKVQVVPNPIDPVFFEARLDAVSTAAPALCFATTPNKNLEAVIRAVVGSDLQLRIIGRLTNREVFLLSELQITYENSFDLPKGALIEAYETSSMLIFPSLYEGFGLPIIEAQALGLPVVTSDREPMRSVAGAGAVLVDPDSIDGISSAISTIIHDETLRDQLRAAGFENVSRYDPVQVAAGFADVYRTLASGGGSPDR